MIHTSVKIFEGAIITKNVEIDEKSSVWFNAVLRGDIEPIKIGKSSNIQDNCVLHSSKDHPLEVGDFVSVGHSAVLHGCNVEENSLIGMNATVLNGAVIHKNSIVGAGALVTEGREFPEGSLILGVPAKAVRKLQKEEIDEIKDNAMRYVEMADSSFYD
ncbi:MAG: gamma carbonic anhydrase family protein [Methanobacterium aggregans]|nr:gamma carbonic anhydrase family protein [Methanobacterium aggregans]MBP2045627.1 carbonic anhydrase/acetyltransferase-like protein (isoleucine patch superfamily) [Methanobacterium aggregans]